MATLVICLLLWERYSATETAFNQLISMYLTIYKHNFACVCVCVRTWRAQIREVNIKKHAPIIYLYI